MHLTLFITLAITTLTQLAIGQTIDPSKIDDTTKQQWCNDQKSSCPLICLQLPGASGNPEANNCDPTSLAYSCVCSNGQQPNSSQYSLTIPYYECTQAGTDCVNECEQTDSSCQSACRSDHPCGAQNPKRVNTSTISTMSATATSSGGGLSKTASTTGSNTFTGFGGASSTGSSKSIASARIQALALGFGGKYGLLVVLGGMMGGFMFML